MKGSLIQCLSISGKARETNEELVMDLVDPLEIGGDCLELNAEPPIAGNSEAVLPYHGYKSTPIILEYRHFQPNKGWFFR